MLPYLVDLFPSVNTVVQSCVHAMYTHGRACVLLDYAYTDGYVHT